MTGPGPLAPRRSLLTELMKRDAAPSSDPSHHLDHPGPHARQSATTDASSPRYVCDFAYFATLTASVRAEVIGETPDGYRVNFFITGGTVRGPGLDAQLLVGGVDWMTIRPDGTGVVDVGVTYETREGDLILEQSGGVLQLDSTQLTQVRAGVFVGSAPYYSSPQWRTSAPAWAWLNREQGFGVGAVDLRESVIRSDIYLPQLGIEVTS